LDFVHPFFHYIRRLILYKQGGKDYDINLDDIVKKLKNKDIQNIAKIESEMVMS
jgi:hypothetical protein